MLADLTLQQFRSYPKRTIPFATQTTLIVGANTAGKTNILEAISIMATGKSFRAGSDSEMIRWGAEVARVTCHAVQKEEKTKLEIMLTTGFVQGQKAPTKKYLVNGIPRRQIDFVGNLRAVLFWPEHLELITDSPSIRRKYLDSVLVQVDREYRRNLISYERGIRQRNKVLERIREGEASRSQLLFWDQLVIKAGGYITDSRNTYIDFVNKFQFLIPNSQKKEEKNNFQITYDKSVISESRLDQYKDAEVGAAVTLVGPHRDDFVVLKSDRDLSKYGSRGEQRLAILWLKLAELAYIEQEAGERPLLLLDDIFSELDIEHRELVLDLLGKQQTILTSAEDEVADLLKKRKIKAEIIRLP